MTTDTVYLIELKGSIYFRKVYKTAYNLMFKYRDRVLEICDNYPMRKYHAVFF